MRRYAPPADKFKATFDNQTTAAPLPNPLPCDIDSLVVTDTGNSLSIGGGDLICAAGTGATGDPGVYATTTMPRYAGRAIIIHDLTITDVTQIIELGFDTNQAGALGSSGVRVTADTLLPLSGGAAGPTIAVPTDATTYDLAIVMRASGVFVLIHGGAFANWTLLWVGATDTGSPIYSAIANNNAAFTASSVRVHDLGGAWGSDYGIARFLVANPTAVTPITDVELVSNGNMESGNPPDDWIASNAVLSAVADERTGGSGSQSINIATNRNGWGAATQSVNVTAGQFYMYDSWIKNISGDQTGAQFRFLTIIVSNALVNWVQNDGLVFSIVSGAQSVSLRVDTVTIGTSSRADDISIRQLIFSSLIGDIQDIARDGHFITTWPIAPANGHWVGLMICLDDETNPQNFVLLSHDGTNARMDKWVGGVYTSLYAGAVAWVNDARLYGRRIPGTNVFDYYYNEVLLTSQTVNDAGIIDNTKCNWFSTDAALVPTVFEGYPGLVTLPQEVR